MADCDYRGSLDNRLPGDALSVGTVQSRMSGPVVQVIEQSSGEIVYAVRITGRSFETKDRRLGLYTVTILELDQDYERVFSDQRAQR